MSKPLPFVPKLQPDESPLSLVRRATIGNFYSSLTQFAFAVNPDIEHSASALPAMARNPERLRKSLAAMGIDDASIRQVMYARTGRGRSDSIIWNGLTVQLGDLQLSHPKFCVRCLIEKGYAASIWDHVASVACAEHRVLLVDSCPCCGENWTIQNARHECGCNLSEMASAQTQCSDAAASLLPQIVSDQDQSGIERLTELQHLTQHWKALGLELSDDVLAELYPVLFEGNWPDGLPTCAPSQAVHPRILLMPLLASASPQTRDFAKRLLHQNAKPLHARNLGSTSLGVAETAAVLGVGLSCLKSLVSANQLAPIAGGRYSASEVNALLIGLRGEALPKGKGLPLRLIRAGKYRRSLSWILDRIKSNEITAYNCPDVGGLGQIVVDKAEVVSRRECGIPDAYDLAGAADHLGTNTESVRKLIKIGLLPADRGSSCSAVQWRISASDLNKFEERYEFGSAYAKRCGVPTRSAIYKLRERDIHPVSGPGVDGGATYLFLRTQLAGIDIHDPSTVTIPDANLRGPHTRLTTNDAMWSSQQAATELGLSPRYIRELVKQEWMAVSSVIGRRWMFRAIDVKQLRRQISEDFVEVENAAEYFEQSTRQFQRTWLDTKQIPVRPFANRRLISKTSIEAALAIWLNSGSASSIGNKINRGRWLCPNLTKMSKLEWCKQMGTKDLFVKLYPRNAEAYPHYEKF